MSGTDEPVLDERVLKLLAAILDVLRGMPQVIERLSTLQKVEEFEENIGRTLGCMLLLQPYVLNAEKTRPGNQ